MESVEYTVMRRSFWFVCEQCGTNSPHRESKSEAEDAADEVGWAINQWRGTATCPKCIAAEEAKLEGVINGELR